MRNIIPANLLMGFGMGFIFVPLTGLTMSSLRDEQIGNGTGIQNLMRNIGGSIGISFVSTMLARYAQVHQVFMAGHLSSLDPVYPEQLGGLQKLFSSHFSPVDALQRAQASLYNVLLQQADFWAYVDLFYVIVWLCVACAVGVRLFRNVRPAHAVALH